MTDGSNNITNLSIEITANADRAARTFDRLASSAERMGGSARNAAGGMRVLKDNMKEAKGGTEEADNSMKRFLTRLQSIGTKVKAYATKISQPFMPVANAIKGAASAVGGFVSGLARIAMFRAYRAIVKDMAQSFKDLYGWSKAFGTEFAKSMDTINTASIYLRNSFAAMVSPIINALAPAFDVIVDKIVEVMNWVNKLFSALTGASTYTVAKKVAVEWGDTFTNSTDKAKKSADKFKQSLMGFDEINSLKAPSTSSSGKTGSSPYSDQYKMMFEEKPMTGGFKGFGDAITKSLKDTMSRITMIISGAALALGAIFVFSGANIPMGLGLMVAGASGLASVIASNWSNLDPKIKKTIAIIEGILGAASFAIGAILAFSGANVPLGIGLMLTGAATIGSAVSLTWGNELSGGVAKALLDVLKILSIGAVGIGAVLAFSGVNVPLGIGLMMGGIAGTAATVNWGSETSQGVASTLAKITEYLSYGAVAVGAILAFSGANVPLGVGLMLGGATGIAASINWGTETTSGVSHSLMNILSAVSIGAVAIGAIFAFTGTNIPLGIGMMLAGITGTVATVDWTAIYKKLVGPIGMATALVSGATLVLGIIALIGGMIPLGIGLLLSGAAGLATSIAANWGNLVEFGKKAIGKVKDGWDTVKLVAKIGISLFKKGWSTIAKFIGTVVSVGISLFKEGWETIKDFIGTIVSVAISLKKFQWTTISKFVGTAVSVFISLIRSGWKTITKFVGDSVNVYISLLKGNFTSLASFLGLGKDNNLKINVNGGSVTYRKRGGAYSGGIWSSIPQYAGGTTDAHGSLFLAGEAGPEIVGHVGNRTEILNRSQLASTMYQSVAAAMATAAGMYRDDSSVDYAQLAEAIAVAVAGELKRAGVGATYLDGRMLAQSINRESRRLGTPAVTF